MKRSVRFLEPRRMELYYLLLVVGLNVCVGSPLISESSDYTAPCSENEVYSDCTNRGCVAKNCSQLGQLVPCVKLDPRYCVKGCECTHGYLRASNGACVNKDQCTKELCPGSHEYYACGSACDNVCATLHEQSQKMCPILNIKCNEMCYCEEGYARDKGGVCVRIEDCEQAEKLV